VRLRFRRHREPAQRSGSGGEAPALVAQVAHQTWA
jgi:hypothetical protein